MTTSTLTLTLTPAELLDGDVYSDCGFQFRVENLHKVEWVTDPTYRAWTAVWTGVGTDPSPGWHRFSSAGNGYRTLTVDRTPTYGPLRRTSRNPYGLTS